MTSLAKVRRAAAAREKAEREWRAAIRQAVMSGETLRAVAREAGVAHTRVLQIVREE